VSYLGTQVIKDCKEKVRRSKEKTSISEYQLLLSLCNTGKLIPRDEAPLRRNLIRGSGNGLRRFAARKPRGNSSLTSSIHRIRASTLFS
jgi:hypothetical protein